MKLEYAQLRPGCADGACRITAKGGILASLHWADQNGPLETWTQLALLPLLPTGTGSCTLTGNRAVPPQATHLLARVIAADFSLLDQLSIPIPLATPPQEPPLCRLLVMIDLHLSRKPWQVRQGLTIARGYDALLITGDLTNDGLPYQMEAVFDAITELLPDTAVFAVAGNHDYPLFPSPRVIQGASDYPALQQSLLKRAQKLGWHCIQHPSGAYLAARNQLRIIGLNATAISAGSGFQKTANWNGFLPCCPGSNRKPSGRCCSVMPRWQPISPIPEASPTSTETESFSRL